MNFTFLIWSIEILEFGIYFLLVLRISAMLTGQRLDFTGQVLRSSNLISSLTVPSCSA
jgi:hypothetical protein